jgi:hypothetical protein
VGLRVLFWVVLKPLDPQEQAEHHTKPKELWQRCNHLNLQVDPLSKVFSANPFQAVLGLGKAQVARNSEACEVCTRDVPRVDAGETVQNVPIQDVYEAVER